MEWTPDFCLSCDRQTNNGAYCSQTCRLMDIEKAGSDSHTALTSTSINSPLPPYHNSKLAAGSAFCLPPPVDFAAYRSLSGRTAATKAGPKSPTFLTSRPQRPANLQLSPHMGAIPYLHPTSGASSPLLDASNGRANVHLTPSSSQASLSSMRSATSCQSLSDQARAQLQGYASYFDASRDWKRRATFG